MVAALEWLRVALGVALLVAVSLGVAGVAFPEIVIMILGERHVGRHRKIDHESEER